MNLTIGLESIESTDRMGSAIGDRFSLGPEQDRIEFLGLAWVPESLILLQVWIKLCYQHVSYQMMRLLDIYMLVRWTGENGELT